MSENCGMSSTMKDCTAENDDHSMRANNPMLPKDYEKDAEKLRGDAIGSTLYSERWLLKVLIALSKFQEDSWCEDLEEQLCSLWDMTFESDVVLLLMQHDFISLAHHILQNNSEPRLTEILVGIIGNMTSHKDVRLYLSQSGVSEFLLALLSTTDTLTLLQLVRLFNSCVWHVNRDVLEMAVKNEDEHAEYCGEAKHWLTLLTNHSSVLNQNLSFILKSSTNDDLLLSSLELLSNLCSITLENSYFSEFLSTAELLGGLLEGLHQLLVDNSGDDGHGRIWGEKAEKASQLWASVINSFCLHGPGMEVIYSRRQDIMRSICIIFDPLGISENLLPLDSRKLDILDSLTSILESIGNNRGYMPPGILPRLLTILPILSISEKEENFEEERAKDLTVESMDCFNTVRLRMLSYCISVFNNAETQDLVEAFGENPKTKIEAVLLNLMKCKDDEMDKIASMLKKILQ